MNRNRLVTCRCGKSMRSDHLQRHNKIHTRQDEQCNEKEILIPEPRRLDLTIEELRCKDRGIRNPKLYEFIQWCNIMKKLKEN